MTDGRELKMYENVIVFQINVILTPTVTKICDSGSKGKGI
jgi:hypothetical protein